MPFGTGTLLVNPNTGGWFRSGYSSLICFQADRTRLDRTAFLLHRASVQTLVDRPLLGDAASPATRPLFSLFAFVDSLIAVDRRLPPQLGLDEQIYRLLATLMAGAAG